jgi:hypothetical protein
MEIVSVDELTMPENIIDSTQYAGKSWAQGNNLLVSALGFENRRLGLLVVELCANNVLTPIHWRVAIFLFVLMT